MSGNGAFRQPWDLPTAIATNAIPAGDALELFGGRYSGDFAFTLDGTAESPVIVRPYNNQRVIIDGSMNNINGAYAHFYDMEFTFSGWTSRSTLEAGSDPSDIPMKRASTIGPGSKFYGCIFYDLTEQDAWIGAEGAEFYDCIFFNCGWSQEGDEPRRGHGHCMYTQNQNVKKVFNNCIFFQAFSTGLKIYTEGSIIDKYDVIGCILFNNGILYQLFGDLQHDWNFNIHGGTTNLLLDGNLSYHQEARIPADATNCIGWGMTTLDGMTMINNYIAGDIAIRTDMVPINSTIENNTIIGGSNNINVSNFPNNTYLAFPGTENYAFVRPSAVNSGKAHVGIVNWEGLDSVEVDLSAVTGLIAGDTVTSWNVQAGAGNDIVSYVLDGNKKISVDMQAASHAVQTPKAWTEPPKTFPTFGAFVMVKV